ncbi:MAG TPA: hypothetical protein PKD16_02095 [Saprospiraceae bacterium]|nr:hypothetical protein [Saprospiraceae bacterium]
MMTEHAPEQPTNPISDAEVRAAETAEQAELSKAQNAHLTRRVVVLRVQVERFRKEADEARLRIHELQAKLAEYEPAPEETPESDPENSPEG